VSEGADWLDQARRLVAGLGQTWTEAWTEVRDEAGVGEGGHVPGGDCHWCPVCQLAAVARRPEVTAALADVLTTAAAALRAVAEEAPDAAPGARAGTGPGSRSGSAAGAAAGTDAGADAGADAAEVRPPAAPVQHIEIG
jgi:hypothetical protein